MTVIEHWFCPGCGEVDGPRAGMICHGPQMTGGCASVRNEVVEISHDAAKRLAGAVEALRRIAATVPSDVGPGSVPVMSMWDAVRLAKGTLAALGESQEEM